MFLTLLITEGRTPECSVKGRTEGVHCPPAQSAMPVLTKHECSDKIPQVGYTFFFYPPEVGHAVEMIRYIQLWCPLCCHLYKGCTSLRIQLFQLLVFIYRDRQTMIENCQNVCNSIFFPLATRKLHITFRLLCILFRLFCILCNLVKKEKIFFPQYSVVRQGEQGQRSCYYGAITSPSWSRWCCFLTVAIAMKARPQTART